MARDTFMIELPWLQKLQFKAPNASHHPEPTDPLNPTLTPLPIPTSRQRFPHLCHSSFPTPLPNALLKSFALPLRPRYFSVSMTWVRGTCVRKTTSAPSPERIMASVPTERRPRPLHHLYPFHLHLHPPVHRHHPVPRYSFRHCSNPRLSFSFPPICRCHSATYRIPCHLYSSCRRLRLPNRRCHLVLRYSCCCCLNPRFPLSCPSVCRCHHATCYTHCRYRLQSPFLSHHRSHVPVLIASPSSLLPCLFLSCLLVCCRCRAT
jgi:hypothetical protein